MYPSTRKQDICDGEVTLHNLQRLQPADLALNTLFIYNWIPNIHLAKKKVEFISKLGQTSLEPYIQSRNGEHNKRNLLTIAGCSKTNDRLCSVWPPTSTDRLMGMTPSQGQTLGWRLLDSVGITLFWQVPVQSRKEQSEVFIYSEFKSHNASTVCNSFDFISNSGSL